MSMVRVFSRDLQNEIFNIHIRKMKFKLLVCFQLLSFSLFAQTNSSLSEQWKAKFTTSTEIVQAYQTGTKLAQEDVKDMTWNDCSFIWAGGEHIFRHRGKVDNMEVLYKDVPTISLSDAVVIEFLKDKDAAQFVDHYYMLQGLKRGEDLEEVRDGITATTYFQTRALNQNDYNKLKDVFSVKNPLVHEGYLKRMSGMFTNHGCTPEINELIPLIQKNVADSDLKKSVMDVYNQFAQIMMGKVAPVSVLKDAKGKSYSFADFKGKVIVIDTWASWCCSCLEKMPKFVKLSQEFKDRDDIVFLTVSIDRAKNKAKWLKNLEKHQMEGKANLINLMPDQPKQSQFETDYHVMGVPRYMMIDKEGKIISAYAPGPGEDMKKLILKALK